MRNWMEMAEDGEGKSIFCEVEKRVMIERWVFCHMFVL